MRTMLVGMVLSWGAIAHAEDSAREAALYAYFAIDLGYAFEL